VDQADALAETLLEIGEAVLGGGDVERVRFLDQRTHPIGLGAGAISFIPYLGAATGLAVAVAIAWVQFASWPMVAVVAVVFVVGQLAESYVLTPRLVGDRIGLHPVWIIFALLAGGALFGFTGVLLAVPVAAVIGVLIRFGLKRYLASPLYTGHRGGGGTKA